MRKKLKKRNSVSWVTYTVVLLIGLAMLYPIIWMFFATFKSNAEIFGSVKLLMDLPDTSSPAKRFCLVF